MYLYKHRQTFILWALLGLFCKENLKLCGLTSESNPRYLDRQPHMLTFGVTRQFQVHLLM